MTPEVDTEPKGPSDELRHHAEHSVVLPNGARLCLDGARLALFDADPDRPGRWLSADALVRLQPGVLWNRLELAEQVHTLGSRAAHRCLALLGLSRLRARKTGEHRAVRGELRSLESAAVDSVLEADESLLVVAPTRVRLEFHSPVLGPVARRATLVLSDRRCLLVAVSRAGDVESEDLGGPLSVDGRTLVSPARRLPLPRVFEPFVGCLSLEPADRALEVARLCFPERHTNPALSVLLSEVARRGDERARWLSWFVAIERNEDAPFPPSLSNARTVDPEALWRGFGLPGDRLDALFEALPRDPHFDARVIDWATREWQGDRARSLEAQARLESDLAFAERLLGRGRVERARQVADDCLRSLARPRVQDALLPGVDSPRASAQLRLYELLLRTSRDAHERLELRLALLRLQPLHSVHLDAIVHLDTSANSGGALGERAGQVLSCLTECAPRDPNELAPRIRPLPADVLERRLRRDLGVDEPALGERFKVWVAKEPRPDALALRQYCERITRADSPILRVVDDAATLLGLGHVDIYVSRGDDDVGVRAYVGERPFVLIGSQHLDESTSYAMTAAELRFALTAELLHVRVGNVRVGQRDVWRGALLKGRTGLDVALGVLPLLKGLKLADRLGVVTAKVSLPQVGRVLEVGRKAISETPTSEAHGLSPAAEKLLETQRTLQLWADRAGLLCAGSFTAALRAMALSRHDTSRAARDFATAGVLEVIERHRTADPVAFEYLMLRIGSLISFYVSDEYSALAMAEPATG